jgi:hypothetical protein
MELSFTNINYLAVVVSALVGVFGLGGLWYSPALFGNLWNREAGVTKEMKKGHPGVVYGMALFMGLISAAAMDMLLGHTTSVTHGIVTGIWIGVSFVATSFAINYGFGGRSTKLFAIDASYHILQFAIYGAILGVWH